MLTHRSSFLFAPLALVAACGAEMTSETAGGPDRSGVVVTAETLAALPEGQRFVIDARVPNEYWFDLEAGAIDFGRIDLVSADGQVRSMASWMEEDLGADYPAEALHFVTGAFAGAGEVPEANPTEVAGVSTLSQALPRRVWTCVPLSSRGGWLCTDCYYEDSRLLYCDLYSYPPRSAY